MIEGYYHASQGKVVSADQSTDEELESLAFPKEGAKSVSPYKLTETTACTSFDATD